MPGTARSDHGTIPARSEGTTWLDRGFPWIAAAICLVYLWVALTYVLRIPLSMDEFQGAHDVYALRGKLPYVDFTPYKTVLGYYVQLPFMMLGDDSWARLIWVKRGMAAINALVLFVVARSLGRVIERGAVLLSLAALVAARRSS